MKAVFDTCIIIDYTKGIQAASDNLHQYDRYISAITFTEVLTGAKDKQDEENLRRLLARFKVIHTNDEICSEAAKLKKEHRMKLGDSLIYATAKNLECLLITRNSKDFSDKWIDVKIPYGV